MSEGIRDYNRVGGGKKGKKDNTNLRRHSYIAVRRYSEH